MLGDCSIGELALAEGDLPTSSTSSQSAVAEFVWSVSVNNYIMPGVIGPLGGPMHGYFIFPNPTLRRIAELVPQNRHNLEKIILEDFNLIYPHEAPYSNFSYCHFYFFFLRKTLFPELLEICYEHVFDQHSIIGRRKTDPKACK